MEHRIIGRPSYSLLELKLKPGEEVLAETGAMVYMKDVEFKTEIRVAVRRFKEITAWWESFFVNRFVSRGEGILGLAPAYQGDIIHIPLNGTIFAQSGAFLASSDGIEVDTKWGRGRTFFSGEGLFLLTDGVNEKHLLYNHNHSSHHPIS